MTKIDPVRPYQPRNRRQALVLLGTGAMMLGTGITPGPALAQSDDETVLTEALVLRDPDIPVTGNPNGDITIVEYSTTIVPIAARSRPNWRRWCRMTARFAWC